jgi:hypothetical protein
MRKITAIMRVPSHLFWMMAIRLRSRQGQQAHLALLRMGAIVKASGAPVSSSAAVHISYTFAERPGPSSAVPLAQLETHPNFSTSFACSAAPALRPTTQNSRAVTPLLTVADLSGGMSCPVADRQGTPGLRP